MTSRTGRYPVTPRTTPGRLRDRVGHDVAAVDAVLDEALICHVGVVVDGDPLVLPMIHARIDDRLYLHASSGGRLGRVPGDGGVPVCVTVTLLDGLVLARSQFHHSMNYRSVVVRGRAEVVADPDERDRALRAIVEHVVPGRADHSRPGTARELAATAVLRVPLREASVKARDGGPNDDAADLALPYWAGVVPVRAGFGPPVPAADLAASVGLPAHVEALVSAGAAAAHRAAGPGAR